MNATQAESRPSGFVTSQRRESPNDPNGFVFRGGYVVGNGTVSLGRPWGPYSRVIFWGTYFTSVVTPQGWDAPGLTKGQEYVFLLHKRKSKFKLKLIILQK